MLSGSFINLKLAPLALMPFIPIDCSGSFKVSDQKAGCIEVNGGEVEWSVSGGVLKVDGDGTAITVSKRKDPLCEECWVKGKMSIHVDENGNGTIDPGESNFENKIDTTNGGPSDASISLGGLQVNAVTDSIKFRVTYDFTDCYGNVVKREIAVR
jgi:hypothetical protein